MSDSETTENDAARKGLLKEDRDNVDADSNRLNKSTNSDGDSANVFLVQDVVDIILPFLDTRSLFNTVSASKYIAERLTYQHVIYASLLSAPWNEARNSNIESLIEELMPTRQHFVPSPLRMLQLVVGKRCEKCNASEKYMFMSSRFGVYACDNCLKPSDSDSGFIQAINIDHAQHTILAYLRPGETDIQRTYDELLAADRANRFVYAFFPYVLPYGGYSDEGFAALRHLPSKEEVWRKPLMNANGDRYGPIVSLQDIEEAMRLGKPVDEMMDELEAKDVYAEHVTDIMRLYEAANRIHGDRREKQKKAFQSLISRLKDLIGEDGPWRYALLDYECQESSQEDQVVIQLQSMAKPMADDLVKPLMKDPISVSEDELSALASVMLDRFGNFSWRRKKRSRR